MSLLGYTHDKEQVRRELPDYEKFLELIAESSLARHHRALLPVVWAR